MRPGFLYIEMHAVSLKISFPGHAHGSVKDQLAFHSFCASNKSNSGMQYIMIKILVEDHLHNITYVQQTLFFLSYLVHNWNLII